MRQRLTEEFRMVQSDCSKGLLNFTAAPRDGNLSIWDAVIYGPEGSDWSGATLKTEIRFPDNYPYSPPSIYIKTRNMFHPNVHPGSGYFCIFMFIDGNWSSDYSIIAALMSVQAILVTPNPDHTNSPAAAKMYKENPAEYRRRVQQAVKSSWDDC
jgi:ubiquitin-protein ligase